MTATHTAGPAAAGTARPHTPGAATQSVGLATMALAPAVMFVAGAAAGADLVEGVPFVVVGGLLAGGALLVRRPRTWATVVGLVLTALAVLGGFWLAFGVTAVQSPADFVPGVAFVLGTMLALVGGIQALRSRHAVTVVAPTTGEARARLLALGAVTLALVVSLTANMLGRTSVDATTAASATPVAMAGFEFTTTEVTVAVATPTLLVRNGDAFLHDLALPDHGVQVTVPPGSEALVDLSGLAPGRYTFYCTLHSDTTDPDPTTAGMAGTLVLE